MKILWRSCSVSSQSSPLDCEVQNGCPTVHFAVYKNQFSFIFDVNWAYEPQKRNKLSFGTIQDWIYDVYGIRVSKSSITQVKNKCNVKSLEEPGDDIVNPELKSIKEKMVLEAFRYFGIV